jgi:deoxyribodipyrimidine photolyase-related protein
MLLIFPNQLFDFRYLHINGVQKILLIEEPRYFTDFNFHKLKLMYHRASMKKYKDYLIQNLQNIKYIEFKEINDTFYKNLNNVYYMDTVDHKLNRKLKKLIPDATILNNPNFLFTPKEIKEHKKEFYRNSKYYHSLFYKFQRKRLNILMDNDNPIGNKWSYDNLNRETLEFKKFEHKKIKKDKYYKESLNYIETNFNNNYGETNEWLYPIDHKKSIEWLYNFFEHKLINFGRYQDASILDEPFLYHSIISPMMNIGLLTDSLVVECFKKFISRNNIPLQSSEGFIRQVIGWRNYMYAIYILEPKLKNINYFNHYNKIGNLYWNNIGIYPIDCIIDKLKKYAYTHHIERLMYLSNWFLINKVDPKEVYRIFMEWTIDAYDWVMVPNVYGMGQYDGLTMTRIYVSSSNYIIKMSRLRNTTNWKIYWDALYYKFVKDNMNVLKHNYATSRQVKNWKKNSNLEILSKKIFKDKLFII